MFWITRNKDGLLRLWVEKPHHKGNSHWHAEYVSFDTADSVVLDDSLFPNVKWEDSEPFEVDIIPIKELLSEQRELKDAYHELIEFKTKKISNLTRVLRGVALEDVADIINGIEDSIYRKYKMVGNPNCSQNCRRVTIPYSSIQLGDNSLQEFIVDDKVVATIYIRRNDFNTADIIVSDLGDEYNNESN